MTEQVKELIGRLERATGPDRQLDAEIYVRVVVLKMYESIHERGGNLCIRYYPDPTGPSYHLLPHYTKSIDAALKLMPEGMAAILYTETGAAELYTKNWPRRGITFRSANQSSVAIALCIAALQAHLHREHERETGR